LDPGDGRRAEGDSLRNNRRVPFTNHRSLLTFPLCRLRVRPRRLFEQKEAKALDLGSAERWNSLCSLCSLADEAFAVVGSLRKKSANLESWRSLLSRLFTVSDVTPFWMIYRTSVRSPITNHFPCSLFASWRLCVRSFRPRLCVRSSLQPNERSRRCSRR
jgi:hypothetical protein